MKERTRLNVGLGVGASVAILLASHSAWCQQPAADTQLISSQHLLPEPLIGFLRVKTDSLRKPTAQPLLARRIATGDTLAALFRDILDPQPLLEVSELLAVSLPGRKQTPPPQDPVDGTDTSSSMIVVTTTKPFDVPKRVAAMKARLADQGVLEMQEQQVGRRRFYRSSLGMESIAFLSNRQYIVGDATAITAALKTLDDPPRNTEKRSLWIETLASSDVLVGGFDSGDAKEARDQLQPLPTPVFGAFRVGIGDATTAEAQIVFPKAIDPAHFATVAKRMVSDELGMDLATWKSAWPLQALKQEMIQAANPPTALVNAVERSIAGIQVQEFGFDEATWRCRVSVPVPEADALAALSDATAMTAESIIDSIADLRFFFFSAPTDKRPELAAELKRIAVGLEKHHQQHGHLPAPAIVDKDGKPLLSWRVTLLPYIGEAELHRRFHLDEPWDSPHNLAVWRDAQTRTSVYRTGGDGRTSLRIFQGAKAPVQSSPKPITDPLSSTILVVQAGRQAFWTQPEALTLLPDGPLPELGAATVEKEDPAPSLRIVHAIMADGSIWRLTLDIDDVRDKKWVRAAATGRGGETLSAPRGERLKVELAPREPLEPLPAEDDAPPPAP